MAVQRIRNDDGTTTVRLTGFHAVPFILLFIPIIVAFLSFGLAMALIAGVIAAIGSALYALALVKNKITRRG
jgi:Flp pilus assembly protein TadB